MAKPGLKPIDELVQRAISGDGLAFTRLWDTHIDALKAYLHSWMGNLDDFFIDDICSKSFEKAFRQIDSFDPQKSQFLTWLKKIAHNTALDTLDAESRFRHKYVSLERNDGKSIADNASTALENIIKSEDEAKLMRGIEGLPPIYREVARLRMLNGMQYKEIAEELGLELNTVRTRIRRAKTLIDSQNELD